MDNFVQWSKASAAPRAGADSLSSLEARVLAARDMNIQYKHELHEISNRSNANKPKDSDSTAHETSGDETYFSRTNEISVAGNQQYDKFIAEFRILTRDMTDFLEKNKLSTLESSTADPLSENNDAKRREENIRRREIKDRINSLLQQYDKGNDRIPMWRHRMRGNFMPRSDQVLKGKSLFRGIALAVYVFYAKPKVQALVKKRNRKDAQAENFAKTMLLFRDACNSWMTKLNRLPIQSIQQDTSLNFSPHQHDKAASFRKRMIQLKVRVKAVVMNIVRAGMPPPHVTKFLGILIEDGNYFKKEFFFECERRQLDFNSLGATRLVLRPIEEGGATPHNTMRIKGKLYDIERPRMLIRNYLLIKLLIAQHILSPWSCGICTRPRTHRKLVLANFRVVATLLYEILMKLDPDLPPIKPHRDNVALSNRMLSDINDGEIKTSFVGRLVSWFMWSGADEDDIGLDQKLLSDHPIFETMTEIQRFLYARSHFLDVQSSLESWLNPLASELSEWIDAVVRHVIETKFESWDTAVSNTASDHPIRNVVVGPENV